MSKDFDSFIKEVVKERIKKMPRPPKSEVWEQVITRIRLEHKKELKKNLLKRLKSAIAACILIAFLAVLYVNFQAPVMAFADRIIKSMIVIKEDTIKIYKKVVSLSNESIPDYLFGRDIDDPRIGETQKKIHFRLFIPEYISKGFQLNKIDIINNYDEKETVTFLYSSSNDKKDCFEIIQWNFPAESNIAVNITKDENTKIEYLTIDGIEYTLISYEKNLNSLLWDNGTVSCEINGNLSRDEIIKIAKSMK